MASRGFRFASVCCLFVALLSAVGCSFSNAGAQDGHSTASQVGSASAHAVSSETSSRSSSDLADLLLEKYDEAESFVAKELEERETAEPIHVSLGEEVAVTDKLAVTVVAVEPGPYDYADKTPTVKVTVQMRNLTDRTHLVKPSNFDADNSDGARVDHKLYKIGRAHV